MKFPPNIVITAVTFIVIILLCVVPISAKRQAPRKKKLGKSPKEKASKSRETHDTFATIVPDDLETVPPVTVEITKEDRDVVDKPEVDPELGLVPLTIGVVKPITYTVGKPRGGKPFRQGKLKVHGKDIVWAVRISSPGAKALRLHIENMSLPDGTELVVIAEQNQADGPYFHLGREDTGDFWTRSLVGDEQIVVVRQTGKPGSKVESMDDVTFTITEVAHVRGPSSEPLGKGRGLEADTWPCGSNPRCFIDAQCSKAKTPALEAASAAIAKMEWIDDDGKVRTCTGSLIADDDDTRETPLMLSAYHCVSKSVKNLETFFSYKTDSCKGGCPGSQMNGDAIPLADTVGMTMLESSKMCDFALFKLKESRNSAVPAGAVYLGWDSSPLAYTHGHDLFRFSTPNWGPMVYSEQEVDVKAPTCGLSRGDYIVSRTTRGGTMGGSSGSPILNSEGEIVGQLLGKCGYSSKDTCDPDTYWILDGAFSKYFKMVEKILVTKVGDVDDVGGCNSNEDCQDGNPCTTNLCDKSVCLSENNSDSCDDGNQCTAGDKCRGGSCQPGEDTCNSNCKADKDRCDDNSECCSGRCRKNRCRRNRQLGIQREYRDNIRRGQ